MDQEEESEVSALREKVNEPTLPVITEMPFDLMERQGTRTTRLVATAPNHSSVDGRKRWYEFRFREPILLRWVRVDITGYSESAEFEFRWVDEGGQERDLVGQPSDGLLTFAVYDLCRGVSFKPPSVFFANPQITRVRLEGVERRNIRQTLVTIANLEKHRADILSVTQRAIARADAKLAEATKAEAERTIVERETTQLKGQIAKLKKNIEESSRTRGDLIAQNTASEAAIADANTRLTAAQAANDTAVRRINELDEERIRLDTVLKSLREDINLFPTEIRSFVSQGSSNIRQYFWLALAPILVIVVMFILLVRGAADLSTIVTESSNINLTALILSRIPYVVISLGIITACYKIARSFISEMVKINNQRLNLTKISIIAKDVSVAAEHGLSLSDEDTYRVRTELKMQLLKDHLKEYISKDFSIPLPTSIGALPTRRRTVAQTDEPPEKNEEQD